MLSRVVLAPELLSCYANQWSCGVVLFVMLSAIPPFESATDGDALGKFPAVRANRMDEFFTAYETALTDPAVLARILPCMTAAAAKAVISTETGVPVNRQRVVVNGRWVC